jgi:hypothetical protein
MVFSGLFHLNLIKHSSEKDQGANVTINDNMTEFMGRSIEDFRETLANPTRVAYRIGLEDEAETQAELDRLLQNPEAPKLQALIVSAWPNAFEQKSPAKFLANLIAAKDTVKDLKSFFLGDMTYTQLEISWIQQCDVSPFLSAYPELLHFGVRGGKGLAFSKIKHENLRSLIVETGGLSPDTANEICELDLPSLEHLELWLGSENYGGLTKPENLAKILNGKSFPYLKRLGLRNSTHTDDFCQALLGAKVLDNLSYLDLSVGTLSDEGAEFLLRNEALKEIEAIDLRHHYLSEEMQKKLKEGFPGVEVNLEDAQKPSEDRYCSVSE